MRNGNWHSNTLERSGTCGDYEDRARPLSRLGHEIFELTSHKEIAHDVYEMRLAGDCSAITTPGQFVHVHIPGFFLRRPISVANVTRGNGGQDSDWDSARIGDQSSAQNSSWSSDQSSDQSGRTFDELTLIYKMVGDGTAALTSATPGSQLDVLTGLGNGYDVQELCASRNVCTVLLIGGGVGVPPLYWLARKLRAAGHEVHVILGFNSSADVFYENEFAAAGCAVTVTTVDGSYGIRGFVTAAMPDPTEMFHAYHSFYACGPVPMLRAVSEASAGLAGQLSFEERMACGFGACMGCSHRVRRHNGTIGYKRICVEGPVLRKEEIVW